MGEMSSESRRMLNALCSSPGSYSTASAAQLNELMETTGGTIMVRGRLRNIEVKQLSPDVFKVTSGKCVFEDRFRPKPLDTTEIDIVFDGPPSHESGRFVEVERTSDQHGMNVGEWIKRDDGYWALRMRIPTEDIKGVS